MKELLQKKMRQFKDLVLMFSKKYPSSNENSNAEGSIIPAADLKNILNSLGINVSIEV